LEYHGNEALFIMIKADRVSNIDARFDLLEVFVFPVIDTGIQPLLE